MGVPLGLRPNLVICGSQALSTETDVHAAQDNRQVKGRMIGWTAGRLDGQTDGWNP